MISRPIDCVVILRAVAVVHAGRMRPIKPSGIPAEISIVLLIGVTVDPSIQILASAFIVKISLRWIFAYQFEAVGIHAIGEIVL